MTEIQPDSSSSRHRSARERLSRASTVAAAAIVALIVLAAVVVIFATRGGDKTPSAAPPKPSRSPRSSPSAESSSSAPSLPTVDQTVPTSPPPGVRWSLFQGVALPSSATAGPSRVDGPVYRGYAHTPVGALLAANQISARYLLTPVDGWRRVVDEQVVPGPGREVFISNRAKVTTTTAQPGTYGQVAGFRFVTYSPDVAVIQVVSRFADGTLQVATVTVRWLGADWRLELQADGGASPTLQSVDNLSGFIPWGGV